MKRIVITIAAILAVIPSFAQDAAQKAADAAAAAIAAAPEAQNDKDKPQYWTTGANFGVGFSQTGLWDWAAGGYNTISLTADVTGKANYEKGLMKWDNAIEMHYGFLWSADKSNLLQKSNDIFKLTSGWTYRTSERSKWNYSASFDFRSQFSNSYDSYEQDAQGKWSGKLKSGLLAPAYTTIALGMNWRPSNWLDVNIAPLTGGFTICTIEELKLNYGMPMIDSADPLKGYRSAKFQFGAQMKATAQVTVNEVVSLKTELTYFTDYLNNPFTEARIYWDNTFNWQLTKLFAIGLNTWLIYDPNTLITIGKDEAGADIKTRKVQFKEYLTIKFTFTISNKK